MENKNDRIERYVYQLTRLLPNKNRRDIEREVRALISDMLEERCGDKKPQQKDIDIVLIELGPPDELAAKYMDHNRYLIGPALFPRYVFVLKILLACVWGGMTLAIIIQGVFNAINNESWIGFFASWFATLLSGAFGVFTVVTLIFAVIENRDKIKLGDALKEGLDGFEKGIDEIGMEFASSKSGASFLEQLPPVPEKKAEIKRSEPMGSIVFGILILLLFVFAPQVMAVYMINDAGHWMKAATIFNLDVLRGVMYLIVISMVLGIVRDTVKLIEGRYTKRLAAVTVACDIPILLLSVFVLTRPGLFNNILSAISSVNKQAAAGLSEVGFIFNYFGTFLLIVFIFAIVLDMTTTVYRAVKYD